jgi:tetratricopeptide (TPR) repeat protein
MFTWLKKAVLKPNSPTIQGSKPISQLVSESEALKNLGNDYLNGSDFEKAKECYLQALELNPDYAEAYNNLGLLSLDHQRKYDDATAYFRQAILLKPDLANAHFNLGTALFEQNKLDEATVSFQRALSLNPDMPNAYFNLHGIVLDSQNMVPSIQYMRKAIELEPSNTSFKFYLGLYLDYCGYSEEANQCFEALPDEDPILQSKLDAWRYIKSCSEKMPILVGNYNQTFKIAFEAAPADGLVLEFGVRFGDSIRLIASLTDSEVHGFDSFEGLPEAWHDEPQGSYSTGGSVPDVPKHIFLHKGWFEDSLPLFISKYNQPVRFINVDCDLYSSTKTILELLATQIVQGTVIAFDEYIGNVHWREDEFRAFQEAVARYGWTYEYLCFSFVTGQTVVRITGTSSQNMP